MNILDLIFPKRCLGCGRIGLPAGKAGKYFCDTCRFSVKFIAQNEAICPVCEKPAIDGATHPGCQTKYSLDGLTSFFRYDGIIRKAVKALKYRYVSDLAHEFISLIPSYRINELTKLRSYKASLAPIPLHPSRFRFRGFNQAEILGKLVSKRLNIPMQTDRLKRIKKITPQVEMKHREDRLKNMIGVFATNNLALRQSSGQAILLFDDVFTTGATMRSAANVLKREGAKFVWAVTMAR
ncbi:ComF family protein [Candidatus Gottesmanbacteria bacterium]|nr:ComF family protein [Candidatus Gottesmanbacteria bacterium]